MLTQICCAQDCVACGGWGFGSDVALSAHGGRPHERKIIAGNLAASLGPIDPEHLLITSGGQHGLAIIGLGLFQRGDAIAADVLTYPGFKSVAALQGIDLVATHRGVGGMDPDALDRQCRARNLRGVYLMPTVHNPLGTVMDLQTRHRLIEVARRHDLIIIEDAAYAFLETAPPPSFITLAPERTIHVGGFSKSLATGLRLGYVIAPEPHQIALLEAIRATTWNAPALITGLVTGWIEDGTLARSEAARRDDGAARQALLREVFSESGILSHPNAGFAWLPLAHGQRAAPIVAQLKEQGLSISGADAFTTTIAAPQALRLAFGGVARDKLRGIFEMVGSTLKVASGE